MHDWPRSQCLRADRCLGMCPTDFARCFEHYSAMYVKLSICLQIITAFIASAVAAGGVS